MRKWMAVMFLSGILAGCNQGSGNEYLGTWKKVSGRGAPTLNIAKSGDQFIVQNDGPFPGKHPAEVKDGALLIHWDELSADRFIVDQKTGHLVGSSMELSR